MRTWREQLSIQIDCPDDKHWEWAFLILNTTRFWLRSAVPYFDVPGILNASPTISETSAAANTLTLKNAEAGLKDPNVAIFMIGTCVYNAQGRVSAALDRIVNTSLLAHLPYGTRQDWWVYYLPPVTRLDILRTCMQSNADLSSLLKKWAIAFSTFWQREDLDAEHAKFAPLNDASPLDSAQKHIGDRDSAECLALCVTRFNEWKHREKGPDRKLKWAALFSLEWMWCLRAVSGLAQLCEMMRASTNLASPDDTEGLG